MKRNANYAVLATLALFAAGIILVLKPSDRNHSAESPSGAPIREHSSASGLDSLRDVAATLETAKGEEKTEIISKGVKIARTRVAELSKAAKTQPERVLKAMMSLDEIAALPADILTEVEQPFSAVAHIDLQWRTDVGADGTISCTHQNIALVGDKVYPIAGEDFLTPKSPIANLPISGYLLDGILLLNKSGVRNLTPDEMPVATEFFPNAPSSETDPVTGEPADPEISSVIGGKRYHFANEATRDYVAEELAASSKTSQGIPEQRFAFIQASGSAGPPLIDFNPAPLTNKNPKVLFIRAKFPIDTLYPTVGGDPVTKEDLEASLAEVNSTISKFSYGQASIDATVTDSAYVLPTPALVVAGEDENPQLESGGSFRIIEEARDAAEADYNLDDFDIVAVYFSSLSDLPLSKIRYGGLATTGGRNHWINGIGPEARTEIITHEFGHNFGLNHANFIDPQFSFANGENQYFNQVSLNYGDVFDKMSLAYLPGADEIPVGNLGDKSFFNPIETSLLSWLPSSKVMDVNSSGTFRIYRFDHEDALANPLLSIRVPAGGQNYDWVSLREQYDETKQSAYITNEGFVEKTSNLVDSTPDSQTNAFADRLDSALPLNASYRNESAGVTFTTKSAGGTEPNQYIDVKVEFDPRVSLQSTSILVDESAGNAAIIVERSFDFAGSCSVSYSTTAGTATSGTDFHATSGVLTWAAGDSSPKTILVPIRPDSALEGSEVFTVTLSNPVNAVIPAADSTATVTILDAGSKVASFVAPLFNFTVRATVPLPDGKIVVGGSISSGITGNIARLNADGSEDLTFKKTTGFNGTVYDIVRQPDGRLLVGGSFTEYNGKRCNRIARLDVDGSLDEAFSAAIGTVLVGLDIGGANGDVRSIALEQDGGIILGGHFTTFKSTASAGVVRLLQTGAVNATNPLTPGFLSTFTRQVESVLVQDDGKIMIGGTFILPFDGTFGYRSGIARLTPTGARDSSFEAGDGAHLAGATSSIRTVNSIARMPDGTYVIGGTFSAYNEAATPGRIARIDADGSIIPSFSAPAINNDEDSNVNNRSFVSVETILIRPNGTILAGGYFTSPQGRITAYSPSGVLDSTISFSGGATGPVFSLASDNRRDIYIGGNFYGFAGSPTWPIVKISGGTDPYGLWKLERFSHTQITSGDVGAEDDFDKDGILNIAEMALGLSPTSPDSPQAFSIAAGNLSVQSSSGGSHALQATMERSAKNLGVWLVAQFSSDLTNWLPANPVPGSNSVYDVVESTANRFTVKDKTASGPGVKRFVRFRAVAPN